MPNRSFAKALILLITLIFASPARADMLVNPGFETGDLSGWTQEFGAGAVIQSSAAMDPSKPHSGQFFFSSSNNDGASRLGANEITISQVIDVSGLTFIGGGMGLISAQGFFSGAVGVGAPSNDTAQLVIDFFEGGVGGTFLGSVATIPIDPIVGLWNRVAIEGATVPDLTDTIVFRVKTLLDPGFVSIDIGADDFSVSLTTVPEPASLAMLGIGLAIIAGYRRGLRRR